MKITICGSCDFAESMKKAVDFLESRGIQCFAPEPLVTEESYQEENGRQKFLKMKPVFTMNHSKKIENSDAVLILNEKKKGIDGYFGSNTLMELTIAFYLGKKIFFLNPIKEDHPHYEEVIGIDKVVLDGDLGKIA